MRLYRGESRSRCRCRCRDRSRWCCLYLSRVSTIWTQVKWLGEIKATSYVCAYMRACCVLRFHMESRKRMEGRGGGFKGCSRGLWCRLRFRASFRGHLFIPIACFIWYFKSSAREWEMYIIQANNLKIGAGKKRPASGSLLFGERLFPAVSLCKILRVVVNRSGEYSLSNICWTCTFLAFPFWEYCFCLSFRLRVGKRSGRER